MGGVISGRAGDYGVVFVGGANGAAAQKKQELYDLLERVDRVARREFGMSLHFGASVGSGKVPLWRTYRVALARAESALGQGTRVAFGDAGMGDPGSSFRRLRRELGASAVEHPTSLPARFERYAQAVAAQCGHHMDLTRAHLESGFERIAEPLVIGRVLEKKSFEALCDALDRAAGEARTLNDLMGAYRRASSDIAAAIKNPVGARHDRNLRRAREYIHEHYAEPLRMQTVAKEAGIAPSYFSRLFRQHERVPFERYVSALRVERAKQLLVDTGLGVARVAEMSGFNSPEYFARVFRRATGKAPLEYRLVPVKRSKQRGTRILKP